MPYKHNKIKWVHLKRLIVVAIALIAMMTPVSADAKSVNRYATKTVALKQSTKKGSKTVYKVKRNTKLTVTKQGKVWAKVHYQEQDLYVRKAYLNRKKSVSKYTKRRFKRAGRIRWGGCSWTWYTQRRLPGRGLKIPGRHVDKHGLVCDKDDYIVLASSIRNKKNRVVVPTPFYGKYGKVYDTNGKGPSNWRDVYTNW